MNRNLFLFALLAATIIASCGQPDKNTFAVPKDAANVFHINGAAISSKISWNDIKASNWFQRMHAEMEDDSTGRTLLEGVDSSGINLQSDLFFFTKMQGNGQYGAFEGILSNAADFEAFNKKLNPGATTTKDGDINIMPMQSGIVTWTNNRFIYLSSEGHGYDGPGNHFNLPRAMSEDAARFPTDSLIKFAKQLYTLKGSDNLLNEKRFASLIKENGDMHLWANAEYGVGRMAGNFLTMGKPGILFQGNITAGTINFENGKITMKSKTYYNDEMAKVYEKYKGRNFDMSVLSRIPSQNVVGVVAFSYPPEALQPFLKTIGMDGWVNGAAGDLGFTLDEFTKAVKGDVLIAVTDLQPKGSASAQPGGNMQEDEGNGMGKLPFNFLFATSINDKASFDKILGVAKSHLNFSGMGISNSMNDQWFAASNSQQQVDAFLKGGNNQLPFIDKVKGNPAIFYLDLQKLMARMGRHANDSAAQSSMNIWEDIVITGGDISDGAFNARFEANLVDKNTNSLKQLNQFFDLMSMKRNRGPF